MIGHTFFDACPAHAAYGGGRALRTVWCADCAAPLCSHCVGAHAGHALQQVRGGQHCAPRSGGGATRAPG
jgi:Na+-translocating ferredoxin:NAD+ oxidoreductase RNF subunit RnfB